MPDNPLKVIESIDPELYKAVNDNRTLALSDGALDKKYKYLIAMALDAADGADKGVATLAQAAMSAGASKEEVAEALRVAFFINGVGSTYTAARGLTGLF
jgi:alkylhydroperoxidase/carboxymuconolactone decarboxylase family protein YurZ